ncbi:MAG TPA: hypothetical protein DCZ49_03930 [Hyphomonadaceae bacterium]|nr:hypothetical protein [Hyphomonadaceae bacterium]
MSSDSIEVLAREVSTGHRALNEKARRRQSVDKKNLASQMATFVKAVSEVIGETADAAAGYCLEEVKLTAELTTEGKVILIGAEGSVTGRGAIEFTFRRKVTSLGS